MIYYSLDKQVTHLFSSPQGGPHIPLPHSRETRRVKILDQDEYRGTQYYKIKVLINNESYTGWVYKDVYTSIQLVDTHDELFDGRFNF